MLEFRSYDTSWLNGLGFPEPAALAPMGSNTIAFNNFTYTYRDDPNTPDFHGFSGQINVATFTERAAPVPEPSSLSVAAFGLAALGLLRLSKRKGSTTA